MCLAVDHTPGQTMAGWAFLSSPLNTGTVGMSSLLTSTVISIDAKKNGDRHQMCQAIVEILGLFFILHCILASNQ